MPGKGMLTIVGLGMHTCGQTTPEVRAHMEQADKLFYLPSDVPTELWVRSLNPTAESLRDSYAEGRPRSETYAEMVDRILAPLRDGLAVCAAFYGHPGIFVNPGHEAIRRARAEGHEARMLPGISSLDCLFADLGLDPAATGVQIYEAMDFLVRPRRFDTGTGLILLQIAAVGVLTYREADLWGPEGLRVLSEALAAAYPEGHEGIVYESSPYVVCDSRAERVRLDELPAARVTMGSTLWVPPAERPEPDRQMLARLGVSPPGEDGGRATADPLSE